MPAHIDLFLNFGLPLLILMIAYFIGSAIERRHFKDIQAREKRQRAFPVVTFETLPEDWQVTSAELIQGNVVISLDYFKRVIAGLRGLIGGRIKTYEPLLDRARHDSVT